MATYAAFKHVELYNVGKTKKRVLKPPGGGSSDIFGSTEAVNASRAQSRNNNASSNIFAAPADNGRNGETPRRARNADSHNRLFGEQERPNTTAKNHMKSSIALGGDETDRKSVTSNSSSAAAPPPTNGHGNGKMHNGNGIGSGDSASTGNKGDVTENETENLSQNPPLENAPEVPCIELPKTEKIEDYPPQSISPSNNPPIATTEPMINNNIDEEPLPSPAIQCENPVGINDSSNNQSEYIAVADDAAVVAVNTANIANPIVIDTLPINPTSISGDATSCHQQHDQHPSNVPRANNSRNPVTGTGIDSPIYPARTRMQRGDGNPVTGEGYKPAGAEINTTVPALNGANQVINKNRVPPGGYSSGLW